MWLADIWQVNFCFPPSDEKHEWRGLYKMVANESEMVRSLWDESRNVRSLAYNGPGESPSKAETQSKCPGRIQLILNHNREHRLWTWRWDLMQQDVQSKWEGRSMSGAIPSTDKNTKIAPKAAKGLPRPSASVFVKKKPTNVLSTASRYVSAWFSDLSQAGVHIWQLVLAARRREAPNLQIVSERSSECTGVNSVPFFCILCCLPAKWPSVHFLSSILDKQKISREQIQAENSFGIPLAEV